MQRKYIKDFKKGDLVHAHGAVFEIIEDAMPSISHHTKKPYPQHLECYPEAPDCAVAPAKWLYGEAIKGYFGPYMPWTFQGNLKAGQYTVE